MADRSDDIKQLFSHLGLNPGDYQEMREKTRALSRSAEDAPTQMPASTRRVPEAAVPKAPPAPAAPAAAVPPTVRLNPLIARAPAATPGEATQRWPLLKAAVETPTRVAQRTETTRAQAAEPVVPAPAPVQATAPQAPVVEKTVPVAPAAPAAAPTSPKLRGSTNEVATLLKAVEQAKALERAESDAIERTTRRVVEELQRSRVPAPKDAEPAAAPVPTAKLATTPVPPAPEGPKTSFFQKPIGQAPVAAAVPPPPKATVAPSPASEPAPEPAASVIPGSELQSAFQRLVDPERVPQQRFSRLKFNYGASETPSKPKKLKEENLEDVFSRISGPPKSR